MKKYYYLLIACFGLLTMQAQNTKGNTYNLPLTGTSKPQGIVEEWDRGGSAPTGSERYTEEGIVLSHDRVGYSGFAIDDLEIDLREGVAVEFEYAMSTISGTGYGAGGGMTFFLFDADKKFKLGYGRSALGYAYNESSSTARLAGLAGGYLGIGFDLSGGFKGTGAMRAYEMRTGISDARYAAAGVTPSVFGNYYSSHITLRGAIQGMQGFNGNPVLYSQYQGYYNPSNDIATATLNYNTGEYDFERRRNGAGFDIANGGSSKAPVFQKIIVELIPDNEEGMYVTVKAKDGGNEILLIDDFYYKHSFNTYRVDGYNADSSLKETLYNFKTTIPKKVKIGFVGLSIDFAQQKTIIRNVKVYPLGQDQPELDDVVADMCVSDTGKSKAGVIDVKVLQNTGYGITWGSFMFVDQDGNKLSGGDREYENSTGKWEFSSAYEEITFTVKDGGFEPGNQADIYYSIELDGVRSKPALFRINGIACGAVVNPHIRSRVEEK
ncbi:hypothetical protein [Myroides profundi]|uniref:Uncharacterized protein n=1 Tax=Myroides profundi TaxID=480520 RepID=A0AAJ5BFC9_MYRPR|nr:hypothetical protein [Myroides profundi]AJH15357.1 hypothetical protein MPR_2186 [Myroides profundi]SER55879.1 hypothetical protein SAMN04488089_11916 [Myroides profundi]